MKTSWNGIKFICRREALVRVAYHDGDNKEDGTPRYSIGFGSQTPTVVPGDTISEEEAFLRMMSHVDKNDDVIRKKLKVDVSQWIWDAISSLFYQAGTEELDGVTEVFNTQERAFGILKFGEYYRNSAGVPSAGLATRRLHEMAMANAGFYGEIDHYIFYDGDPRIVARREMLFPAQPMR